MCIPQLSFLLCAAITIQRNKEVVLGKQNTLSWELGFEAERWVKRLLELSGYGVTYLNPPEYHDGKLIHYTQKSKKQKALPDFEVTSAHDNRWLVEVKYRAKGELWFEDIELQLGQHPTTKYILVRDNTNALFTAISPVHITERRSVLKGEPLEAHWPQVTTHLREHVENELRATDPFNTLRATYKEDEDP